MDHANDPMSEHAPVSAVFDEFGLPAGDAQRTFLEFCGQSVAERVACDGWDQQPRLFAVLNPLASIATVEPHEGLVGTPYRIVELPVSEGNPATALMGVTLPSEVAALILSAELWASARPEHAGLPSSDPDRIEARMVQAVSRSDASWFTLTSRHGGSALDDPHAGTADRLDGLITDMMRRALSLPITGTARPVSHLLATRTMLMTLGVLEAMTIDTADPSSMVNVLLSDGALPDSAAGHVAAVTRAVVTWQATGCGRSAAPEAHSVLEELGTGRRTPISLNESETALLESSMAALAGTTWAQLASDAHARDMLPSELQDAFDAAWCGEVLSGKIVFRFAPEPDTVYSELVRVHGTSMAREVADKLSMWWTPGAP